MFETQKSGNKTSWGEIGLDIRTHASPKVGQDHQEISFKHVSPWLYFFWVSFKCTQITLFFRNCWVNEVLWRFCVLCHFVFFIFEFSVGVRAFVIWLSRFLPFSVTNFEMDLHSFELQNQKMDIFYAIPFSGKSPIVHRKMCNMRKLRN